MDRQTQLSWETAGGKAASDDGRTRGAGFTSLDLAFRFRRPDGGIEILLGEWKYMEMYTVGLILRCSKSGTDRFAIYRPPLEDESCLIVLGDVPAEALFFDPFDQLMRQQILYSAMEHHREVRANVVSPMHVAPAANRELIGRVNRPGCSRRAQTSMQFETAW